MCNKFYFERLKGLFLVAFLLLFLMGCAVGDSGDKKEFSPYAGPYAEEKIITDEPLQSNTNLVNHSRVNPMHGVYQSMNCFYTKNLDALPQAEDVRVAFTLTEGQSWQADSAGLVSKQMHLKVDGDHLFTHYYVSDNGSFPYNGQKKCWNKLSELVDINDQNLQPSKQYDATFSMEFRTYTGENNLRLFLFDASKDIAYSDLISFNLDVAVDYNDERLNPFVKYQWHLKNTGQKYVNGVPTIKPGEDGVYMLNTEEVHKTYTGKGVQVAVVDSELEMLHPDLQTTFVGSLDLHTGDNDPTPGCWYAYFGHGISVAGIIAARHGNRTGGIGVAPGATLAGLDLVGGCGNGVNLLIFPFYLLSLGVDLGLVHHTTSNSHVIAVRQNDIFNMSFGKRVTRQIEGFNEYEMLQNIFQQNNKTMRGGKGASYTKAAGNAFERDVPLCEDALRYGVTCINANFEIDNNVPQFIVVGALDPYGTRSFYSTAGSTLFVSGPAGVAAVEVATSSDEGEEQDVRSHIPAILTTDLSGCKYGLSKKVGDGLYGNKFDSGQLGNDNCDYTSRFNGTSAAAPAVAGVLALMLEANPELTWREIKHILASTAKKLDSNNHGAFLKISQQGSDFTFTKASFADHDLQISSGWPQNINRPFAHSDWYGFGGVDAALAVDKAVEISGKKDFFQFGDELQQSSMFSLAKENILVNRLPFAADRQKNSIKVSDSNIDFIEFAAFIVSTKGLDVSKLLIKATAPTNNAAEPVDSIILTPFTLMAGDFDEMVLGSYAFYSLPADGTWDFEVIYLDSDEKGTVDQLDAIFYGH